MSLATWGEAVVKHVQRVPQQFTVGHDLVQLTDVSSGVSDGATDGTSDATAAGTQEGTSDQLTNTLGEAVNRTDQAVSDSSSTATGRGRQSSSSETRTMTATNSRTVTRSQSRTIKQQLVPRIITREIVTSIQFQSPEEIDRDHASNIVQFKTGEAYLLIGGLGTFIAQAPLAEDPLSRSPKFAARQLAAFLIHQWRQPEFVSPQAVLADRQVFLTQLLQELASLPHAPAIPRLALPQTPELMQFPETIDEAPWRI